VATSRMLDAGSPNPNVVVPDAVDLLGEVIPQVGA
jgi:hypothetical protein